MFKSSEIRLTPKLSFAIALLYMATADGILENEEITYLSTVMHGDGKTIMQANKYIKEALKSGLTFDMFLKNSNEILSEDQKECILVNLVDMMLSDGFAAANEEKLLERILKIYGFEEQKYLDYKRLMIIKNNHKVFLRNNRRKTDTR